MKINSKDKELINRWTDKFYLSEQKFFKVLQTKKLTTYHGVDPTAPDLHLGHSTNYLLLRKFQDLGHKVIILIGDFTAQIGDPTGRLGARKPLTNKQVLKNSETYKEQVAKILEMKKTEVRFNSKWLKKLNLEDVMKLAATFTYGKMIKRNMFQERIKKGQEIFLPEFIYPLLQGYDSVAMDVDVEVGGTDQTFNMLVGRQLMKVYKKKEKFVVTTPLLENPKTGNKLMSKSEGNYISLNDNPDEMFGKVMALPDEAVTPCFKMCTELSLVEIKKIGKLSPRDQKARLAREITEIYHNKKTALSAEKEFNKVFKDKKAPTKIPGIKIKEKKLPILDLLIKTKLVSSKAEAKRLILQKGVRINEKIQDSWQEDIEIKKGLIIQVGKRKFVKLN